MQDSSEADSQNRGDQAGSHGVLATIGTVTKWAVPFKGAILLIFVILLLEMAFSASVPMSFKFLIDRALIGREQAWLYGILTALAAAAVVISAAGFGRDFLVARVVARILGNLRSQLFERVQSLGLRHSAQMSSGSVLACFSGHLATIEHALAAAIPWAVLPGLEVFSSVVLLFFLDWRLASAAMLVFPMTLIGPRSVSPRATRASFDRRQEEGNVLSIVQENLAAKPVVVAFGLGRVVGEKFQNCNVHLLTKSIRLGFLNSLVERTASVGIVLLQLVILGIGTLMAFHNEISIGSLTAFQTLFLTLSYSLSYVTQYVPSLIQASGAIQHLNQLLEEPHPARESGEQPVPFTGLREGISVCDVSFSYEGSEKVLSDISFDIARGTSVAFVGPSGSGKSTMINLLMRSFRPLSGAIRLDGLDLQRISEPDFRRRMAVVFQESFLFNTTIRENIRLGRLAATDAEIEAAAKTAEIHDVIQRLPNGYETMVGERGGKLSGGQRQRIAVARAIVRDPDLLILDEATSALDPVTEAKLNETLSHLARGRTVVAVTHRLQGVVDYDRICVFEHGRLAELGTHRELLAKNGIYAKLWQKQHGFTVSEDGESAVVHAEKLREFPIFSELSDPLRAELAKAFNSEQLAADRAIFEQEDPGDKFYVIVRGKVSVEKRSPSGETVRVAVLTDGDFFGEVALLRQETRNATVRTLIPCMLLTLQRPQFLRILGSAPELKAKLLKAAEQRS